MYWVTGTPGDPRRRSIPPGGFGDCRRSSTGYEARGISWKFYIQNYDPAITFRSRQARASRSSQVELGAAAELRPRTSTTRSSRSHIVDLDEYFDGPRPRHPARRLLHRRRRASSEHPPGSVAAGQRFVRKLIERADAQPAWKSSAFMWTYDDWGGWYDHVRPPQVDRYGYGFRVAGAAGQPVRPRGYVDHTPLDFTSILRFIEENWGLQPLASRDREGEHVPRRVRLHRAAARAGVPGAGSARAAEPKPAGAA